MIVLNLRRKNYSDNILKSKKMFSLIFCCVVIRAYIDGDSFLCKIIAIKKGQMLKRM